MQQKLRDQQLNAALISNTIVGSGVYYLGNGLMGVQDETGLQHTVTLLGMRFNARVVVVTDESGNSKLSFDYPDGPVTPRAEKLPEPRRAKAINEASCFSLA